jgi:hypothetical protein
MNGLRERRGGHTRSGGYEILLNVKKPEAPKSGA